MASHALLSASSAHQWLACPPSARLSENIKDSGSEAAREGTDAHALCEYKVKTAFGIKLDKTYHSKNEFIEDLSFYNSDMERYTDEYLEYVKEQYEIAKHSCSDPKILVEQRLDYSKFCPEGFGTGDCLIIADDTLHIIDFKYGLGTLVNAEDNPQMKLYALGALELFGAIYDISTVSMTVFQPRRENVSTCTVFKESLYNWAEEVLIPTAQLAYNGEGEHKTGEHCKFCRAKTHCRKMSEEMLKLAKLDFKPPALLTEEEFIEVLKICGRLSVWASDVKNYAEREARAGRHFEGFKLATSLGNRKITDEQRAVDLLTENGYNAIYSPQKLKGIGDLEKLVGKKKFAELLGGLIIRPEKAPSLVPETSSRREVNDPKNDFNESEKT
jgi:hypothetical protein